MEKIKIGNQVWMKNNLNVEMFQNGDIIQYVQNQDEWENAGRNRTPAWCYYNNDPANGVKYGKLYNWYAVNDSRGLAPNGWKIPTEMDWDELVEFLGGAKVAGGKMKNSSGWKDKYDYYNNISEDESGNGTNESLFSGLPGGSRDDSAFYGIETNGIWWTADENSNESACTITLFHCDEEVSKEECPLYYKGNGMSVRCLSI
jgi:uncharacterized protein (TIGR02145 family)